MIFNTERNESMENWKDGEVIAKDVFLNGKIYTILHPDDEEKIQIHVPLNEIPRGEGPSKNAIFNEFKIMVMAQIKYAQQKGAQPEMLNALRECINFIGYSDHTYPSMTASEVRQQSAVNNLTDE